jgi:hypothetical protein
MTTKQIEELRTCPTCGALPCDWVDDPFAAERSQTEEGAREVELEALRRRAAEAEYSLFSYRQHRAARSAQINAFIKERAPELWDDYATLSVNGSVYSEDYTMEPTLEREMNVLRFRVDDAERRATEAEAMLSASPDPESAG